MPENWLTLGRAIRIGELAKKRARRDFAVFVENPEHMLDTTLPFANGSAARHNYIRYYLEEWDKRFDVLETTAMMSGKLIP